MSLCHHVMYLWNFVQISLLCVLTLTHWGRVTHICVSKLTIIGSDNSLSPGRRQAIIWTNVGILLIRPLGTNFSEILIEIHAFYSRKCIGKCSLENGGHFVPASMCMYVPCVISYSCILMLTLCSPLTLHYHSRESHCEIERRRRNKMTTYINELCDMVPTCSTLARKPDKLTILRMAVSHMKNMRGKSAGFVSWTAEG